MLASLGRIFSAETEEAFDMIAPFLDVYRVEVKGFSDDTYLRTWNKH
jgi:hypothetical protein